MKKIVLASVIATSSVLALDLEKIHQSCAQCHGADYTTQAMGVGQVVADMSLQEIKKTMIGYKDGTYGGRMQALMAAHVKDYSDDELNEISKYVYDIINE